MLADSNPAEHTIYWVKDLVKKHDVDSYSQCSDGCSYCCHQIVSITIFEAMCLAKGLDTFSNDEMSAAFDRASQNVMANDIAKTDHDRWANRLPCSLLVNQSCSVYEYRPIACIATTSADKDYCIDQFNDTKSEQHCPPTVMIEALTPIGILTQQVKYALTNPAYNPSIMDEPLNRSLRIDLDRFVKYYCVPDRNIRAEKLELLATFDFSVLKLLEKRTE